MANFILEHKKKILPFLPAIGFACLFFLFSSNVILGKFAKTDLFISTNIQSLYSAFLTNTLLGLTYLMNLLPVIIFSSILGLYFLAMKKFSNFFVMIFTLGGGALSMKISKELTGIVRPESLLVYINENSYPSGHATIATIFFALLIYFFKDKIRNRIFRILFILLNIFLILIICFSRIYLNAHWFSDVVAGIILGLFWLSLVKGVERRLRG